MVKASSNAASNKILCKGETLDAHGLNRVRHTSQQTAINEHDDLSSILIKSKQIANFTGFVHIR